MAAASQPMHATLIAAWRSGRWQGALLRGRSGIGKSDLALRTLAAGWALVADDRVSLWVDRGALYGAAPPSLSGLIEARNLGVISRPALRFARVTVVVEPLLEDADRIPEPAWMAVSGIRLPCFRLTLDAPGSVVRLGLALDAAMRRRPVL